MLIPPVSYPDIPASPARLNPVPLGVPGIASLLSQLMNNGQMPKPSGTQFTGMVPSTNIGNEIGNLVGTTLAQEAARRRQKAQKMQEKALQMAQEAAQLEAPKMQMPITGKEAGIGALIMAIAGALGGGQGASEFAQGFLGSRQALANQTNEEAMRRYQMQQSQMGQLADIEMKRAGLEMGESDRIQGMLDTERSRAQKLADDKLKRRETGLYGTLQRLTSDLDRMPYERIPTMISQINTIYDELGMPEAKIAPAEVETMVSEAKAKAAEALKVKEAANRNTLLSRLMPYIPDDQDRNKLAAWVLSMSPDELDIKVGRSDAELRAEAYAKLAEAKTKTEDAMREPRLREMDAKINKLLGGIQLDQARTDALRQKIAFYPDEFKVKVANAYSLIASRQNGTQRRGERYPGDGIEAPIRSAYNAAKKVVEQLSSKATSGAQLSAEEARALQNAIQDTSLFGTQLAEIAKNKTAWVRGEAPLRLGIGAPGQPPALRGEITSKGTRLDPSPTKSKTQPKTQPKAPKASSGKTRSGTSFQFIED